MSRSLGKCSPLVIGSEMMIKLQEKSEEYSMLKAQILNLVGPDRGYEILDKSVESRKECCDYLREQIVKVKQEQNEFPTAEELMKLQRDILDDYQPIQKFIIIVGSASAQTRTIEHLTQHGIDTGEGSVLVMGEDEFNKLRAEREPFSFMDEDMLLPLMQPAMKDYPDEPTWFPEPKQKYTASGKRKRR